MDESDLSRPIALLLAVSFVTCSALFAARSFTLQQVMKTPFASELTVAQEGARIAWVVNSAGRRNIWVASGPEWKGRPITNFNEDDGQEIQELAWLSDGSGVLFARGGDFATGREAPNPAVALHNPEQDIWLATTLGGDVKKLAPGHAPCLPPSGSRVWFLRKGQIFSMKPDGTDVKSEIEVQGSATDLTWSPDGHQLASLWRLCASRERISRNLYFRMKSTTSCSGVLG